MSQDNIQVGTKVVSRFPYGLHKLVHIRAEVAEVTPDGYRLRLSASGCLMFYGIEEMERTFCIDDGKTTQEQAAA